MLTQGALAAATYSNLSGWNLPADATPVMLSYLPLAHIYGVSLIPSLRKSPNSRSSSCSERSSSTLPQLAV